MKCSCRLLLACCIVLYAILGPVLLALYLLVPELEHKSVRTLVAVAAAMSFLAAVVGCLDLYIMKTRQAVPQPANPPANVWKLSWVWSTPTLGPVWAGWRGRARRGR